MKPAAEFDEIKGRFEPIIEMLSLYKEKARAEKNAESLALVRAVQALTREVRDLERRLLADHLEGRKFAA